MIPFWFLWGQVVMCIGAAIGLAMNRNYWFAFTWFCYALANIGWIYGIK